MYLKKPDYEQVKKYLVRDRKFPSVIVLEVIARCNLRCILCPYPKLKREKGEMSFETYQKIVDEIAIENTAADLWLAFLGEPLLMGERLLKMIAYAKQKGIERVHLNTNAMFLTKEMSEKLIDSGIRDIIISLDGFSRETYERIRVGGDYRQVVENVENLLKVKKEKKAGEVNVICQFIVTDENEHEIEAYRNYWTGEGATVKIRPKLGWGTGVPAEVFNVPDSERTFPCPWTNRGVTILWDGRYAQCDADFEGLYSAGNNRSLSIRAVWNGEFSKRRERHWAGDFSHPLCRDCRDWQAGRSLFFYPQEEEALNV